PGADPRAIRMRFEGAEKLRLASNGDLVVSTSGGSITLHQPSVYQERNGARVPIDGGYILAGSVALFRLGVYDRTLPLVIDPVLVFSTYLGGSGSDTANAVATDAAGNVYVAGRTGSPDFPVTPGAIQNTNRSTGLHLTAFVSKLDPTGSALV